MSLLWRGLILRPARRDPLRVLLSVGGIAIGVAAVAAIQRANRSVVESFSAGIDAVSGRARLTITGINGVPESAGERLRWFWRVGSFAPAVDRFAICDDGTGEPVEILGIDVTSEEPVRRYRLVEPTDAGRMRHLFEEDAALVPLPFARAHRLALGNTIRLVASGKARRLIVAGLLDLEGPARASEGQIVVTGLRTAQRLFDLGPTVDRIDLVFPETVALAPLRQRLGRAVGPGLTVDRPAARAESAEKMIRAFRFNLAALGAIALLVGAFLIYNTLSISVLRRRPEIGILRALGASRRAIFAVFLTEGLALGAAGTLLGEGLGGLLSRAAIRTVGTTVADIYAPTSHVRPSSSPRPFLIAAAVGLAASIIASVWPAAEAAAIAPATTMRAGSVERERRARLRPLAVASLAQLAAAGGLSMLPAIAGFPAFGFLAMACVVGALACASPLAILGLERTLRRPLARFGGSPGRLAGAFFAANLSRNAVAVAALSLALGMACAMAVMISSLRGTVKAWVEQSVASDLFIKSPTGIRRGIFGTLPPEVLDFLRSVPGVEVADPYRGLDTIDSSGHPFTVGSGDFATAARIGALPLLSRRDPAAAAGQARRLNEVFVSEPFARRFGKWRGSEVELPTPSGPRRFRVADVYADYSNDRGTVVIDRPLFLTLYHDASVSSIAVAAVPGVSPEELRRRILRASRGRFALSILTNRTLRREVMKIFDQTFAVTYGLEAIAIGVAILGVANALFALVLERRREIALLRVIGASPAQIRRSIVVEAALLGTSAIGAALLSGAAFSAILIGVINRQSFGWTIRTHVPASELATEIALVLATTLAASALPARRASRAEIAPALREE